MKPDFEPSFLPIIVIDERNDVIRLGLAYTIYDHAKIVRTPVVSKATRVHEHDEANEGPSSPYQGWRALVRERIGDNHDARATDGIDDGLIRAERWNAVY